MKLLSVLLILVFFTGCSFDNKTGIWKSESNTYKKKSNFEDFKTLSINKDSFNEVIKIKQNFNFNLPKKIINNKWEDIYYNKYNNFDNFSYNEEKNLILKSKKLSKYKLNRFFLYDKDNVILTDDRGNLIVYSIEKNQIVIKFNFYKKQYKKIKKTLNIVISEGIIYVSDNLGFIYAFDYKEEKILWAKDNKVPFRSNLKIENKYLVASDQNNRLYLFDKNNGNILKLIPTEETKVKNDFKNNFSINNKFIFMLNTYGSLYAIDSKNSNVKWVLNLNQSLDINPSNLFNGHPIVNNENYSVVTSQDSTYIINSINGAIISKLNIISKVKPLIVNNYLYLVSSNNLFICVNLKNGEIIYSNNINKKIAEFWDIKEEIALIESIMIANNKILILLKNAYMLEFEAKGDLKNIFKLPTKINSDIIFINNSILYLDHKNKLILLN
jgi:outer membrane protein assembly factor BamB